MSARLSMAILLAASAFACPASGQDVHTRTNASLDPSSIAGPQDTDWDTPPTLVKGKAPIYPISRLVAGASGSSTIVYTIGVDGKTRDFEIENTDDEKYANHAMIAVSKWVFKPAIKDGVPIEARVRQEFNFGIR